jgi:hypothetical protein
MMLDDKTKISFGLAITVIGGGAAWLTSMSLQTIANAKTLDTLEIRQVQYSDDIDAIKTDIAVIRTQMELLTKGMKNDVK